MTNFIIHRSRIFMLMIILMTVGIYLRPLLSERSQAHNIDVVQEMRDLQSLTAADTLYLPLTFYNTRNFSLFGVEMSRITWGGGLGEAMDANMSWVRRGGLIWSNIEPVEGHYEWTNIAALEQELITASSKGIEVILVVRGTPSWAQDLTSFNIEVDSEPRISKPVITWERELMLPFISAGSHQGGSEMTNITCAPILRDKLDAFGNFLSEAVKKYSIPPFNVKYWQIWNEPDANRYLVLTNPEMEIAGYGCWGDSDDQYYGGGYYSDVLEAVYPKMKEANPEIQIITGGLLLACNPAVALEECDYQSKYLECILGHNGRNNGGDYFDILAFHAYDYYWGKLGKYGNGNWASRWNQVPALVKKKDFLTSILNQYGYDNKPLMVTETSLLCGATGLEPVCQSSDYQKTKAAYVSHVYASALAEGFQANIWYSLLTSWRSSALLDKSLNPLPAYHAYRFSVEQLSTAIFVRYLFEYPNVQGYVFTVLDQELWILWSTLEDKNGYVLPTVIDTAESPQAVWDVFGNSKEFSDSFLIAPVTPIYVLWERE